MEARTCFRPCYWESQSFDGYKDRKFSANQGMSDTGIVRGRNPGNRVMKGTCTTYIGERLPYVFLSNLVVDFWMEFWKVAQFHICEFYISINCGFNYLIEVKLPRFERRPFVGELAAWSSENDVKANPSHSAASWCSGLSYSSKGLDLFYFLNGTIIYW
jgi:hypothetical protein